MTNPAALPEIYAPLDVKIAPLVEAMRAFGFPTTDSCDGSHAAPAIWLSGLPWVNVAVDGPGDLPVGLMRLKLIKWLREHNVTASVLQVYSTIEGEPQFPYIRIEVFSDLAEAQL